jgi:predicted ArsR family transcriptional regulator
MAPRQRQKTALDRARVLDRLGTRPKTIGRIALQVRLGYFAARRHLEALVSEGAAVKVRVGHAMGYRRP